MTQTIRLLRNIMICGCFIPVFFIAGCATTQKDTKPFQSRSSRNKILQKAHQENKKPMDGSLWQADGPLSELFINPIARRVGDIVTVRIVEIADATNKAGTDTDRKSSLSLGLSGSYLNPLSGSAGDLTGKLDRGFAGAGTTQRSNKLTANITAKVIHVFPNGNLAIAGSREILVNNENQLIALTGIIRPRDISTNNVIESSRISDARISYSGTGVITDSQRKGWLSRIFDWISPF